MDPRPIVDKGTGNLLASKETTGKVWASASAAPEPKSSDVRFPGEDGGKSLAEMAQRDLSATLQLLAERAQYITGATGAAIALRDQDEMVCRASAGSSAPEVGTLLQVNSGLSGESVRTRQTLRCDDAYTDSRVNRESCEALGIRSVVVMPLIRSEAVIGVFELFSDKANIFQTRDLVALERMGAMVHTALEHSTAALGLPPMLGEVIHPARSGKEAAAPPTRDQSRAPSPEPTHSAPIPAETSHAADQHGFSSESRPGVVFHGSSPTSTGAAPAAATRVPSGPAPMTVPSTKVAPTPPADEDDILEEEEAPPPARPEARVGLARASFESLVARADQELILSDRAAGKSGAAPGWAGPTKPARSALTPVEAEEDDVLIPLAVPHTAVANLKKCAACGFPVSEGRQLCLDCEKKNARTGGSAATLPAPMPAVPKVDTPAETITTAAPNFMTGESDQASWLSNHKFTIIAVVLAAVGIAAVVLLR